MRALTFLSDTTCIFILNPHKTWQRGQAAGVRLVVSSPPKGNSKTEVHFILWLSIFNIWFAKLH